MRDLSAGIVRILTSDGRTAGTGFVVAKQGLLVTCAHVVTDAGAGPDGLVDIVFHATGDKSTARVHPGFWRSPDAEDLAVLSSVQPLPDAVRVLGVGSSDDLSGDHYSTFGFPAAKPVDGLPGKCEIVGYSTESQLPVVVIRSNEVSRGFSGAPMWDNRSGRVVGIVTSITGVLSEVSSPIARFPFDPAGRQTETAFAIPTETLSRICPLIPIERDGWRLPLAGTLNRLAGPLATDIGLYAVSLLVFMWTALNLRQSLEALLGLPAQGWFYGIAAGPVVSTILLRSVPMLLRKRTEGRLKLEASQGGARVVSGYFRLQPYEGTPADREGFDRSDRVHETVAAWIQSTRDRVLYLTGRSGVGKSSLLNAYVLPRLGSAKDRVVRLRGYDLSVVNLRSVLIDSGLVPDDSSTRAAELIEVLQGMARKLKAGQRVLIIIDQFEEFLIIHERDRVRIEEVLTVIGRISAGEISGIAILLVTRSDYLGKLQDLRLSTIQAGSNWLEVSPFSESAARGFLMGSGLGIDPRMLDRLIIQTTDIEGTPGLIRPITLNMIGVVLSREWPKRLTHVISARDLFIRYVERALATPEIKRFSIAICRALITAEGTRKPRTLAGLASETGYEPSVVLGCLLTMSQSGIVRRIDDQDDVWEISHDFVARLLAYVVGRWHITLATKFRAALAPLALVLWLCLFVFVTPYLFERQRQGIIRKLTDSHITVGTEHGELELYFPSGERPSTANLRSLRRLPNLRKLDFSEALLQDTDLQFIRDLTGLRHLDLSSTGITDRGIAQLELLHDLQTLSLGGTKVADTGMKTVGKLTALTSLNLSRTGITDQGLYALKGLGRMEVLTLYDTRIRGGGLEALQHMKRLRELDLENTSIKESGFVTINHLNQLQNLDLSDNEITDQQFQLLKGLTELRYLDISDTSLTDEAMITFRYYPKLEKVDVTRNEISDTGLLPLRDCTQLRSLILQQTQITGKAFKAFRNQDRLEELWMKGSPVTDQSLVDISRFRHLKELSLPNTQVTDRGATHLARLADLRELYLGGNAIAGSCLPALSRLKKLKVLFLPGTKVTDAWADSLLRFSALERVGLEDTAVTRQKLKFLKEKKPGIKFGFIGTSAQ